jgi:hypothetical protein
MSALEDDLAAGNEAYDLLRHCLMADDVSVAVEAAKAALRLSDTAGDDLMAVLSSAYEFWLEHEEPYPKGGGTVPRSPRPTLLQAIQKTEPVSDSKLFELIADDRSDVRDLAEKWLIGRMAIADEVRTDFLGGLERAGVKPRFLTAALRENVPFSGAQLTRIRSLLNDPNAEMRYAAMGVLLETYLATEDIIAHASALVSDSEQDIRDRAHRIRHKHSKAAAEGTTARPRPPIAARATFDEA